MKITDFPSLSTAIADFAHRADVANFQYFIQFGELKIYRDIPNNNMGNYVQWMERPFTGFIDANGLLPLPSGYLSLKEAQVTDGDGDSFELIYKDPEWIYSRYPCRQPTMLPAYIAREGTNFIFGPFPSDAFQVNGTAYAQSAQLTASNPQTWMTTVCPDLLFSSCMMELQPFLRDVDGQEMWSQLYQDQLSSLIALDMAERFAPGTLTMDAQ